MLVNNLRKANSNYIAPETKFNNSAECLSLQSITIGAMPARKAINKKGMTNGHPFLFPQFSGSRKS